MWTFSRSLEIETEKLERWQDIANVHRWLT